MINHDELIEKTNTILDGVSRLKQEWERSKDTIESVNQMRIVADGYIRSLLQYKAGSIQIYICIYPTHTAEEFRRLSELGWIVGT